MAERSNPTLIDAAREAEKALEPCPFCGGAAEIMTGDESAWVQCVEVKMHRAMFFSGDNNAAEVVRDQWNRRAALANHQSEGGEK